MVTNTKKIPVEHREIYLDSLPSQFDNYKILFLSDFHIDKNHNRFDSVLKIVRKEKYDICLLGGDYINNINFIDKLKLFLKELKKHSKVYAIVGNHDYKIGKQKIVNLFKELKIKLLLNESITIKKSNVEFDLIGVESAVYDDDFVGIKSDLKKALKNSKNKAKILLSHTPDIVIHEDMKDISLVLSGHTHAGQIVLPVIGPLYTSSRLKRKYSKGLFTIKNTKIYVSRGLGNSKVFSIPFTLRFNCPYEITMIKLKAR